MEQVGNPNLKVFVSSALPWGEEWDRAVHEAAQQADWLILLYTDPSVAWDWCLYETGYFAAHKDKTVPPKKLVVLHSPGVDVPGPLSRWQSYAATEERMTAFLGQVYLEPPRTGARPINPTFKPGTGLFRDVLLTFLNALGTLPTSERQLKEIVVETPDGKQVDGAVPEGARVIGDSASLEIFGMRQREEGWTWAQFMERLSRGPRGTDGPAAEWGRRLGEKIFHAATGEPFSPGLPMLRSLAGRAEDPEDAIGMTKVPVYRPALAEFGRRANGKRWFRVLFVEPPPEVEIYPTRELGAASHLLTLSRMIRWGVLEKYEDRVRELARRGSGPEECRPLMQKLLRKLRTVMIESRNRGIEHDDDVTSAFDREEDRQASLRIIADWVQCQRQLENFTSRCDPGAAVRVLRDMRRLNREFIGLICRRYAALMHDLERIDREKYGDDGDGVTGASTG
jgi:hypothetical protein